LGKSADDLSLPLWPVSQELTVDGLDKVVFRTLKNCSLIKITKERISFMSFFCTWVNIN
jgi:hypothetical protein